MGEVVRQPGLGHGAKGDEPLLAALAPDPEVAVRQQVANAQIGRCARTAGAVRQF